MAGVAVGFSIGSASAVVGVCKVSLCALNTLTDCLQDGSAEILADELGDRVAQTVVALTNDEIVCCL